MQTLRVCDAEATKLPLLLHAACGIPGLPASFLRQPDQDTILSMCTGHSLDRVRPAPSFASRALVIHCSSESWHDRLRQSGSQPCCYQRQIAQRGQSHQAPACACCADWGIAEQMLKLHKSSSPRAQGPGTSSTPRGCIRAVADEPYFHRTQTFDEWDCVPGLSIWLSQPSVRLQR